MARLASVGSRGAQAGHFAEKRVGCLPFCGDTAAGNSGATAKGLETAVHNVALIINLQQRLRGPSLNRNLQTRPRQGHL